MRRFLFFTLMMVIFLATMVCAAILYGHIQPPSMQMVSLHLEDCDPPCWMGITPGMTDLIQAESAVKSAFPNTRIDPVGLLVPNDVFNIYLRVEAQTSDPEHDPIAFISLQGQSSKTRDALPTLGDMIAQWGSPTCFERDPNISTLLLIYADEQHITKMVAGFDVSPSMWRQHPYGIDFYAPGGFLDMCSLQPPVHYIVRPWRGFVRTNR